MEILDSILELRDDYPNFEDDEKYRVFDIALPVAIYECSANQKVSSEIDALAKTILKLINRGIIADVEIAKLLHINVDMVLRIKTQRLHPMGFIDECCKVTEIGQKCLNDDLENEFNSERIYGNMFVNLVDGDIMPFFFEGTIPISDSIFQYQSIHKIVLPTNSEHNIDEVYIPAFTNAYKLHHKILGFSGNPKNEDTNQQEQINEFDLIATGFDDVIFFEISSEDQESYDSDEEFATLADVVEKEQEDLSYVKVFKTTKKIQYLYTKMIVNRRNPSEFIIFSPFPNNATTWYTKKIPFMKLPGNGICIQRIDTGETSLFGDFVNGVTEEFYVEYPELADSDFDWFKKAHFPNLLNLKSDRNNIEQVLEDYYRSVTLNNNGQNAPSEVLTLMGRVLETILNRFIGKVQNRYSICNSSLLVPYSQNTYSEIFSRYNAIGCTGQAVGANLAKKIHFWGHQNARIKGSIPEKYCFLILEGYIHSIKPTPFINCIKEGGRDFLDKLDYLISVRNKYTSHNDNIDTVEVISTEDFDKAKSNFIDVICVMINGLYKYQEGRNNGN